MSIYVDSKVQEIVLPTLNQYNEAHSRKEAILRHMCGVEDVDYPTITEKSSRIERFLDAIFQGIEIDIEPRSRTEILLQAIMLGLDTVDIKIGSRGEVLLYKILTGDDNIDDIEPLQSRYELYLAWMLLNGGMGDEDYELTDSFIICENGEYLLDVNGKQIKLEQLLVSEITE